MKLCERNMRTLYYATYASQTEIIDEYGNVTANYDVVYSEPQEIRCNLSPAKGSASLEMFGEDLNYSKTMVVSDMECPIDEHTVLWVDSYPFLPDGSVDANVPYDYVVVRVAKSLNNIAYAIKKVDAS